MDAQIAENIASSITARWNFQTILEIEENQIDEFPDIGTVTVIVPDQGGEEYWIVETESDYREFIQCMNRED